MSPIRFGGWEVDPHTGLVSRDETHGMHTPVRHTCGALFDLVDERRRQRAVLVTCPGCHCPAERLDRL